MNRVMITLNVLLQIIMDSLCCNLHFLKNSHTDIYVHTQTGMSCPPQVCAAGCTNLHTHLHTHSDLTEPSDANTFSCDANTFQEWFPQDKFNADRYIPPPTCHQQTHLVSLSASTHLSVPNPVAILWPFWHPLTAAAQPVKHRWNTVRLGDRIVCISFNMWFKLCPHSWFFQMMSWACIFVGMRLLTLEIHGQFRMTDDSWP